MLPKRFTAKLILPDGTHTEVLVPFTDNGKGAPDVIEVGSRTHRKKYRKTENKWDGEWIYREESEMAKIQRAMQSEIQAARFARIPTHERCAYVVYKDIHGKYLEAPRNCRGKAKRDGYCGVHARLVERVGALVTSTDGGWCIWCSAPARRYSCSRADAAISVALCASCGTGLHRELRNYVKKVKRKT